MASLTRTRSDLVTRALQILGAVRAGQNASAEDSTLVDGVVDGLLADLSAREIVYVADPEEIPVEAFEHLAKLLAFTMGTDFGPSVDANVALLSESRLRTLSAAGPTYEVLKAEYF